jgi:mRNA interferase RelE/StbE
VNVQYRQLFLKDLKKLKNPDVYGRVYELSFTTLPSADSLQDLANVKAMVGYAGHYRIRVGDYRIGIILKDGAVEVMRVLHRREFYRYFP